MHDLEIGYELSQLARAYINKERQLTMVRDPSRSCSPDQLLALVNRHGLPFSSEIVDFEANLGGWCSSHALSAHGYGVYLSLQEGQDASSVARELRQQEWIFEGKRDEVDEDGEASPLWGTGYPRAFFMDRPLVPAGMLGLDVFYFLGTRGEVYRWVLPLDELFLVAGSGRTMLECSGLRYRKGQSWFEAHICADVSILVQEVIHLQRFEPACDHLFQWWINDTVHVRLVPDYAPCIMGTHVACKNEDEFIRLVSEIKDRLKVERIRIWKGANAIVDQGGIDSLLRAGIDCETLTGPGPGHGSDA